MTATLTHVAARAVVLALWHARLVSLRVRLAALTVAQGRATGSPAAQRDDSARESVWKSEGRRSTLSGDLVDITRRRA